MKLSLSARTTERFDQQAKASMSFAEFIRLASETGYEAVCMRPSLASIHTPPDVIRQMKKELDALGLKVSRVAGNFEIPHNDDRGPDALRHITPHLDLAEAFDSPVVRICMKKEEDIPWAQKSCDEARERGIRLVHQCHPASLFETVEEIRRVIRCIQRDNFGIIYEPASLRLCGQPRGQYAVDELAPHIFDVSFQNFRIHPRGRTIVATWRRGEVRFDGLPLPEPGDVDFKEVIDALWKIQYDGFVTVHQAFGGILTPREAAQQSWHFLRPLIEDRN